MCHQTLAQRSDDSAIPSVTIRLDHSLADVSPGVEEIVVPALTYESVAFEAAAGGVRFATQRKLLCDRDAHSRIVFPRGLLPRVTSALNQAGYRVCISHVQSFDGEAFAENESCSTEFAFASADLLAAVRENPLGLIESPPGQIRSDYIGVICRVYHRARIIIPCATVGEVDSMGGQLLRHLGGNIDTVHKRTWSSAARVVVCTFASCDSITEPRDFSIVIFPDAEDAIGKLPASARGQYLHHRIYGFVEPNRVRSPRTTMRLEALAGPVIYRAPQIAGRRCDVQVVMAESPLVAPLGKLEPLARRQQAIWSNDRRNDTLAALATGFAAGDIAVLWEHGLFLDRDRLPAGDRRLRVLLLVETAEHGRELQRRLPDWPLLHLVPDGSARSGPGRPTYWPMSAQSQAAIMTALFASKLIQIDADVVIWASGGERALLPECFPPWGMPPNVGDVLLVDLADDSDAVTSRWTHDRVADYLARGFQVLALPRRLRSRQEAS